MKKSAKTPTPKAGASRWLLPAGILAAAITAGVVLGGLTSETGKDAPAKPAAAPQVAARPSTAKPAPPAANTIPRVKLDLANSISRGPKDAPITLVEITAFQCGFCKRSQATIQEIMDTYPGKVRHVVMYKPLRAPTAAIASLAADRQGKYWEYRNLLFANQSAMTEQNLLMHAQQLGMDVEKFTRDRKDPALTQFVQNNSRQASTLGVRGTPTFFINGRAVRGAQPMANFAAIINQELAGNLPPTKWVASVAAPPSRRPVEDPNKVYKVDMANSISRGPKDAPITLVEVTAFQCGFCKRSQATIQQIMDTYPGKVRHVVMYKPLRAPTGAIASLAADRQGKYWEYRKLLFANQRAMTDQNLQLWAQQLDMDVTQFQKDRQDPALAQFVQNNSRQASALGVNGTPTFFINGKKLVGAQPFAAFQRIIDQHLKAPVQAAAAS